MPNGYAARSLEVINLAREAGWSAAAVTRLGYPQDINRFRDAEVPEEEAYGGVPCRLLPDPQDGLRGRVLADYLSAYADAVTALEGDDPPAILHAASSYHNGLAAAAAARRLGVASVYEARGLWELTALSRGDVDADHAKFRMAVRLETEAARAADAVIALSDGLKQVLIERGVDGTKIFVLPNTAVLDETPAAPEARHALGLPPSALVIGYVGSLVDYEGVDLLVEAVRRATGRGGDIAAFIVGGGPARDAVLAAAEASGLGERLVLLPRTDRTEAARLARTADIVVLPRRDLPVTRVVPPIKVVEAYARGQPVVVSDVHALAELVEPGLTGLVVPSGDPDALTDALLRLSADRALVTRMGEAARNAARTRFGTATVARTLERAYAYATKAAS